ncbi:hypothetical protein M5K25_014563 [Dendrobium thyrsiflorum]|uniref:Uncharacterized protein n=1 Tax=Dendrobium thyrsiflorum TaxID=117978 RepID=A0ABD0UN39_DENTH
MDGSNGVIGRFKPVDVDVVLKQQLLRVQVVVDSATFIRKVPHVPTWVEQVDILDGLHASMAPIDKMETNCEQAEYFDSKLYDRECPVQDRTDVCMHPCHSEQVRSAMGNVSSVYINPGFNFVLNSELDVSTEDKEQVVAQSRCGNLPATAIYGTSQAAICSSDFITIIHPENLAVMMFAFMDSPEIFILEDIVQSTQLRELATKVSPTTQGSVAIYSDRKAVIIADIHNQGTDEPCKGKIRAVISEAGSGNMKVKEKARTSVRPPSIDPQKKHTAAAI